MATHSGIRDFNDEKIAAFVMGHLNDCFARNRSCLTCRICSNWLAAC